MRYLPTVCAAILLAASITPAVAADRDIPVSVVPVTTITETRNPRSIESLTGAANVVDREIILLRNSWTAEEALSEVPGVDVVGSSRYGQEVRLNTRGVNSGYGTQRTLVLLDGRPLTDEYLGNVDLAQYPLSAMRQIELVRGPASSVYGTNAMGGVLNLIPRRGRADPFTEISAQGGTFGTFNAAFAHGTMMGPVDFFLSVEGADTNGYMDNSRGDDMDWQRTTGFLNLGLEEERFSVRTYLSLFGGDGTDEDFDRDIERNLEDLLFTYRLDPEHDAETRVRVYRSELNQTLDWFERPESDYDQIGWGASVIQTWRPARDHLLTGGVEWRLEQAEVGEAAGDVDEEATTWSLFLQDEFEVADGLLLVGGVRYDKRSGIDGEITWRAGANWQATPGTTIRGAVGRAFRAPTISDQYLPETAYFGVTFMGNPDLDPERLLSAEIGVDQVLCDYATLSVTAFASRYKDYWDFIMAEPGIFRPMNIARVKIWGLETEVAADLGGGFSAVAGYTLTNAEYTKFEGNDDVEGNRLDDNVKHRGSAALTWRHPDGHGARLGVIVSGNRPTDPENTRDDFLDPYYVFEFAAQAQLTEWAAVTFSVENALNRGYRTRPEFRQPGRAIFAGLRLTF